MREPKCWLLLLLLMPILSACAGPSRERVREPVNDAIATRLGEVSIAAASDATAEPPDAPISRKAAVLRALQFHPEVRQQLAALGYSQAELHEAFRIGNPALSLSRLHGDGGAEITRALSLSLTDLLTLPDRRRIGQLSLQATQAETAKALLDFAAEVEKAWFEAVAAGQKATLAQAIRKANRHSADLADRMVDAGTLRSSEAAEFRAEAAAAAIAATRAEAHRLEARLALANWLMLPVDGDWTVPDSLPMPANMPWTTEALSERASQERLDLVALQHRRDLAEQALRSARRWRWLGSFELEGEQESGTGEADRQGGALQLELPLFSQAQATILRAEADLSDADAALAAARFQLAGDVQIARSKVLNALEVARIYRQVLLPNRERVVAGKQADVNFMLDGVFELLSVRAQQFEAYSEYLEAILDYWLARTDLRTRIGGRWPEGAVLDDTDSSAIDLDTLFPKAADDAHAHH